MPRTIIVRGSYGNLIVHRPTGLVLGDESGEVSEAYADILFFDPDRFPAYFDAIGEGDILDTAFVTDAGRYIERLERVEDEDGFFLHADLLRLPPPA